MDNELFMISIMIVLGIIEIAEGIPLLLEKIKPNSIYGFRTPKTRSGKDIWYKANKYVGRDLIFAGIFTIIVSFIVLFIFNNINLNEITLLVFLLIFGPLIIVIIRGYLYLKKL